MNNNAFILELDTTGPQISVDMAAMTNLNRVLYVVISSNEELGPYQDIKMRNPLGEITKLIFSRPDAYTYVGNIGIGGIEGIYTLFVQLEDAVSNLSNVANVNFLASSQCKISSVDVDCDSRTVVFEDSCIKIEFVEIGRDVTFEKCQNKSFIEVLGRTCILEGERINE